MTELWLWGLFLAVGVGTFALRLSFIELYGQLRIPTALHRALAYVPASVLAALVLPAVITVLVDVDLPAESVTVSTAVKRPRCV